MFASCGEAEWLETFRLPLGVRETGGEPRLTWEPSGRSIGWPAESRAASLTGCRYDGIRFFAGALADGPPGWGRGWRRHTPIERGGVVVAHVWRSDGGDVFLPFNPDTAVRAVLSEAYLRAGGSAARESAKAFLRRTYYLARPLVPRNVQLAFRRQLARAQRRQAFPRWPLETSLHDLYALLLSLCAEVADEPVPWIAAWPTPHTWAVVLTHDVETGLGYANVEAICREEARRGFRSSWNFVPRRDYAVADELVAQLRSEGFEVGVHGLHHDGRDLASMSLLRQRLPEMRDWADRWGAAGFRAPATQRGWDLMAALGFEYDSSYPDTDPYEPQGGGCCSWLPFFNKELVELPITLPQDHTLFAILGESDSRVWVEKARAIRQRGGMALIDTHPDYLYDDPARSAYHAFLDTIAAESGAWHALPRDVAAWWRDRAATSVVRDEGDWRAVGPAADRAAVTFVDAQAA